MASRRSQPDLVVVDASPDDEGLGSQIISFSGQQQPDAFRKAVQFLHCIPYGHLSLLQRKMMDAWSAHAIATEPDDKGMWELSIVQLSKDVGFDSNNREHLTKAAKAFMRMIFEWDVMAPSKGKNSGTYKASVFVPEVEIHPHCVRYAISSHLRGVMKNPEVYAVVDQNIGRKFSRNAAYVIWQFCTRYERIGQTASLPWEHLRDMILGRDSTSSTYDQYKFFNSKVLKPAIAEVNEISPIEIVMREGKEGRRVSFIQFTVRRKGAEPAARVGVDEDARGLIEDMALLRVSAAEARRFLKNKPTKDVRAAIDYVKRRLASTQPPIENIGGYFRAALEGRYFAEADEAGQGAAEASKEPQSASAGPMAASDLSARFEAKRLAEAQASFDSLPPDAQAAVTARYNAQQAIASLKVTERQTKASLSAFGRWMVLDLWGKTTERDLAAFAQEPLFDD
jgi:hypothetical protein